MERTSTTGKKTLRLRGGSEKAQNSTKSSKSSMAANAGQDTAVAKPNITERLEEASAVVEGAEEEVVLEDETLR